MKKLFGAVVLVAGLTAFAETPKAKGSGEGALKILAWPGYIERGESDKKYDWVTQFEKDTGCKVEVVTASTSDEMVKVLSKAGTGFDLVTASGDSSVRLIKLKRVQAVDIARVPSWATVDPRLQKAPWHTIENRHYGVPYQWGPNLLIYNTKVFKTPPTSWSIVFEPQQLPDGQPNAGRVEAYDGAIAVADAALYLMKKSPELNIRDPYELTPAQYKAALKVLKAQRKLVSGYWHDTTAHTGNFKSGKTVASIGWGYQVNTLLAENQPVASTVPAEGTTGWADTTMLLADAPHPLCSYRWMEWSLKPEVQAAVSEWFGALPAVPAACKVAAPHGSDFCKTNGAHRFEQIRFWKTPEMQCSIGSACVPYFTWHGDYEGIKSSKP